MSLSDIRRAAILCPVGATGGPEALHQLGYMLNALGLEAYMAYFGRENMLEFQPEQILCRTPQAPRTMSIYGDYAPQVTGQIPLGPETLIVMPESITKQARHPHFRSSHAAVWWLSADNAYVTNPELREPQVMQSLAQDPNVIHLCQSVYARDVIRAAGGTRIHDLGDYTSDIFNRVAPRRPPPKPLCAYNAAKGGELAHRFFAQRPDLQAVALKGFSKAELRDLFRERLIYVDFGHFPGKDRLPREAAACGDIVFVRREGAGACYDDFPIPDFFKFDLEDVDSGELARRIDAVIAEPMPYWRQLEAFRTLIAWEKRNFQQQAMRLLGRREPV